MLPKPYKIGTSTEFSEALAASMKAGSRFVVVYHSAVDAQKDVASCGPKFGFIVSKAVGNAVVRHRVSRRLRHVCAGLIPRLEPGTRIIIRALPRSASATSKELEHGILAALARIARREAASPDESQRAWSKRKPM